MNQTRCWSLLKLKSDVWSCQVMPNSSAIAKTYRRGTQLDEVLRKFLRGRSKEYSTEKESSWAFHNQHCQESFLSGSLAACCNSKPHGHILPQFCVLTKVLRGYPRTEAPTPERHSRSSGLRVVSPWGILISSDIHRFWTHRKPKGRAYSGPTLESDISMFTSAVTHLTSRSPPQVGNIPFRFFFAVVLVWSCLEVCKCKAWGETLSLHFDTTWKIFTASLGHADTLSTSAWCGCCFSRSVWFMMHMENIAFHFLVGFCTIEGRPLWNTDIFLKLLWGNWWRNLYQFRKATWHFSSAMLRLQSRLWVPGRALSERRRWNTVGGQRRCWKAGDFKM